MGIAIYIENRHHERVDSFFDNADNDIMKACAGSPQGAVFRGVMQHGDTMLNVNQLRRAIGEVAETSDFMPKAAAQVLRSLTEKALSINGYLYFVDD
jgi:hypothetical protein